MTRHFLFAAGAALLLAACQPQAANSPTANTVATNAAPSPAANATTNTAETPPAVVGEVLNPDGYGPLRVGMTWEQALAAMPGLTRQVEEQMEACYVASNPALPGVYVMFEDRALARVSAREGSTIGTAEGIRVGATEAAVRAAYGSRIVEQAHHYEAAPAKYLTVWAAPNQRGIRFETNEQGVVGAIHAGGPQIEYIEGCA